MEFAVMRIPSFFVFQFILCYLKKEVTIITLRAFIWGGGRYTCFGFIVKKSQHFGSAHIV